MMLNYVPMMLDYAYIMFVTTNYAPMMKDYAPMMKDA